MDVVGGEKNGMLTIDNNKDKKSQASRIRSHYLSSSEFKPMQIGVKTKNFEENSNIDQDDAYGNYRPMFLTKNTKVTGRTHEIMKLQRMASLDQRKSLLGPVQPDLSN